jgi:hypothetical protein
MRFGKRNTPCVLDTKRCLSKACAVGSLSYSQRTKTIRSSHPLYIKPHARLADRFGSSNCKISGSRSVT